MFKSSIAIIYQNPMMLRVAILTAAIYEYISLSIDWGFSVIAPHTFTFLLFFIAAIASPKKPNVGIFVLLLIIFFVVVVIFWLQSDYVVDLAGTGGISVFLIYLVWRRRKFLRSQ